ncbi:MAG TPA: heme lyase CcmF/NrfE family subunit [Pelagibacteraceae bacterium]|jgi:cytochrome c-type biogenesis protein CcmF|nr:heme lyase CcmF/NrfE family subunit [Pelagibacteraceae bacterium]
MAPYLGNFALWLSLCFAVFQFINSSIKNNNSILQFNKIAVNGLLFCSLVSFFSLMYSHVVSDFSLINVFQNSHTTKPLLYKISGVWGNHEGSMLLWILVLTIFNFFIFKLYNQTNSKFVSKVLETQALITVGFVLFTILTSNPFERMDVVQTNGLGFNPILQDPALAIHPPLLYIGYVGFSAAFSMSIATLSLGNNEKILWYSYMKPFVIAAWTFLTIGIALGSVWAYYELGWGGWWFWDPVENASFMPWLLGTALLHSLITVEKKKSLQSWVLLLSILAFLLSVVGTFLVRSGILTSIHTFALDPSRGIYILAFTAILGGYSLILFGLKSKKHFNNSYFSFFSKEGSILVNNILMVVVCASVFLGTIYPLLVEAFTNNKISVGEPYYNTTVVPIMIPAILVMGIGPMLSWGREDKSKIFKKIFPSILLTAIITIFIFLFYQTYSFIGIVGILLAFWIISNSVIILFRKKENLSNGMIIAHLGIGLLILGITGSSVWQEEKITQMKIGNETNIQEYNIILKEINEIKGPNYLALQGNFFVYDKNKNIIAKLKPENRFYPIRNNFTTEASIHTNLLRDLYIVLGEGNLNDGWVVRIYYNPLVIWIWIGALTIFLGGIVSMNSNLKKLQRLS